MPENINNRYAFLQDVDSYVLEDWANSLRSQQAHLGKLPMLGGIDRNSQTGLLPKTKLASFTSNKNKFKIGNTIGSALSTVSGVLGGPAGWISLGVQAIGDSIKAAQSQFDLQGMQSSISDYASDFNQYASSADNSSDILNLATMMGNDPFSEEINNSGYKWDGNILGGIGAIFGNDATERDKQKARDAVSQMQSQQSLALNNAATTVSNKDYNRRMTSYFNNAAFGGPLNTHGADFSDDIIRIDAGGTHEQNPLGGVPAGLDPQGIPNLVEEGERIWDDYVFSDRLKMPKSLVNKYKLGGRKNKPMTFAEGVDKLTEKLGTELRPNDPITKRTKDAILTEFENVQEEKRMQQEKRELLKAMAEMTPEEFAAMLQSAQQPVIPQAPAETMPIEEQVPPQGMNEGMMEEPVGLEQGLGVPGMAYGGNLFRRGGNTKEAKKLKEAIDSGAVTQKDGYWSGVVGRTRWAGSNERVQRLLSSLESTPKRTEPYTGYEDPYFDSRIEPNLKGFKGNAIVDPVNPWYSYLVPNGKIEEVTSKTPPKPTTKTTGKVGTTAKASAPVIPELGMEYLDDILAQTPTVENTPIALGNDNIIVPKMQAPVTRPELKDLPTWMRYAPVVGGGLSILSDIFDPGDYSGAENLLSASRRLSNPVRIPVTTIGNRLRRNPFDERLMVNQANQNLAAGIRSTLDTAGGNRAYRQYATSQLVRDNQGARSELARNAYLANRQDALQTADFNRQTDLYNMNAINQRNLTEAQINNANRMQGFNARMQAQNYLDSLRRQDDQLAAADMTAFLTSLGNIGNENEQRNWLTGLAREGILNYNLGRDGRVGFVPSKNGGKIKTKKRRF